MSSQKADTDGGKSPHLQEIMNESDDPAQRSSLNNSSPVEPDHQPQCTGNIESCQPQENNVSSQQQVLADQDNNNDIGDYSRGGSFHLSMCSSDTSGDDLSISSGPNTQKTTNDSFDITSIPSRMGQDFSTEEEYPFEDEKARMIANLMKNHGNFVSASLVERSNLIQSVGWLSRHVPGCVLKFLIDSVHRAREEKRQCSERNDDLVYKRGMDYNFDESDASDIALESFEELNDVTPNAPQIHHIDNTLPIAKTHQCALLFVDMSGFTKISTMLDVESLSDAINSYFEMIVNAITSHGGDILKFAGDAIFAEWKVSEEPNSKQNLEYCVSTAANCGATIVSTCSNYPIFAKQRGNSVVSKRKTVSSLNSSFSHPESDISEKQPVLRRFNRRGSMHKQASMASLIVATLNVKCGVGMGQIVGMHVGDNISRREYLILGDPIDQVANAEGAATLGEVFSSPEATACLAKVCDVEGDWKSNVAAGQPTRIAVHKERFFQFRKKSAEFDPIPNSDESGNILRWCEELDFTELQWLKKTMSLYVHPVVVNDDDENTLHKRETDQERHQAEAELRNVYVMFIMPLIEPKLTGDNEKDQKLFKLLNDIMNVTTRELDRLQGHLRQFIVDDKGVVLIGTFGLRGSTFPNMIAQRAIPVTLAIHEALQEELGVKNRVGGTFGRVYCGIVGGLKRHEFAALGPSVNLSARLMASKSNPGVLVDKNVRMLTSQVFFKPLPAVKAKGYDDPVPIFVPVKGNDTRWGQVKKNFVGRAKEIKQIMHVAKDMSSQVISSKFVFISAMSGTGKSTLVVQATERVRAMLKKMNKRVIVTRNISNDGDSRVPFSLFRSIFKDLLLKVKIDDDMSQSLGARQGSKGSVTGFDNSEEFSIDGQWDELSLHSHSTNESNMSTDATRFRYICKELNAPPEFMEVVGKRLLGLRDKGTGNSDASTTSAPNLKKIVDFMADAFIRCTRHVPLVLLAIDDVQWLDEMSWKVVQAIFERAKNVLILCGSRPPSENPLSVDPGFWSDLHEKQRDDGRFMEMSLTPFGESDVQELIASTLGFDVDEIESSFVHNVFTTSGGMPHFMSYVLDSIKRNDLTVRLENGLIGLKSAAGEGKLEFGSVGELLLYRLDALDSSVRSVLHLSAVLGMEFDLLDAALAYEEIFGVNIDERFDAITALRESYDVAVEEGIIEESFTGGENNDDEEIIDDEHDLCASLGQVNISLTGRKAHPFYADNRRYRFTHDSWKTSILSCMLGERKCDLHEHIAIALERELDSELHGEDDFERQIRIFKHWNSSGNFVKSADIALNIGSQLMLLGLNTQGILLFNDTLAIMKEQVVDDSRESHGGICGSVLDSINVPELERLIKLNISKGKAFGTLGKSIPSAEGFQSALDIIQNTPCAADDGFDRSVSFPIFSGLFVVLKMGAIKQDAECNYEKDLCKKFVEQARLNGDPVHYGRALAMQAETLGRLSNFEQAFEALEKIKTIYNIETQHAAICKSYGSDRVAQAFSHSVNWNRAIGRIDAALDDCKYIVETLLPKSDPKNVHNSFCLLYSALVTMKDNGLAFEARDALVNYIMKPFEEHFGPGASTFSKPLFKPILVLLDLQGKEGKEVEQIDEYMVWASDEKNMPIQSASLENAWAAMAVSPSVLFGEIYYYLAKRQEDVDLRIRFIKFGISLMKRTFERHKGLPFATMYSIEKIDTMTTLAKENCIEEYMSTLSSSQSQVDFGLHISIDGPSGEKAQEKGT